MQVALVGPELEENLSLRSLAAALNAAGHEAKLVCFDRADQLETAVAEVLRLSPPIVGLSMVFTARAREFAQLARALREGGYRGHILAGGHFAAFHAEKLLRDVPALDAIAIGDGEPIITALANNRGDPRGVAGLVWRDGEGCTHALPAPVPDLDTLPHPLHRQSPDQYLGLPIASLLSSRGCRHSCAFCSIAAWHRMSGGPCFRARSPDGVADEMAALYRRGVRIFSFHDDNFVLRDEQAMLERVTALCAALRRRGVERIACAVKARPESVTPSVLRALRELGLFRLFLGIEAGTEASLQSLGRRQSVTDNERALLLVNEHGIHTCFNLLLLNPDSTLEDCLDNVAFLRRHPHNPVNFCRTEIYAGTPLEARLRREGRLRGDYWGWDYSIADERAELFFRLMVPVFRTRNWGPKALHHLTMRVDYEAQLCAHFWPERLSRELHADVKAFIRRVNFDTCEHLERMLMDVGRGRISRENLARAVARERRRLDIKNEQLRRAAEQLRARIALCAGDRPSPVLWLRTAAAAGLAASLSMQTAACKSSGTYETEMAPDPSHCTGGPAYPCEPEPATAHKPDAGGSEDPGGVGEPPPPEPPDDCWDCNEMAPAPEIEDE